MFYIPPLAVPGLLWLDASMSNERPERTPVSTLQIVLLFVPWAFFVSLGHVAKRDFRAHLRRRHPRAYQRVYGVHADRSRHSALDPLAWLLQLRFELSNACHGFGDAHLSQLGQRLRRHMLAAVALYFLAIAGVLGAAHAAPAPVHGPPAPAVAR